MAEKVPKRKAKPKPGAPGVLGTLPASRPERLGAPRAKANKPRAVRPAASALKPHRTAEPPPRPIGPPRGTELVATTIRAAGELAQIGFTLSGHALKRAVDRIRPGN